VTSRVDHVRDGACLYANTPREAYICARSRTRADAHCVT